MIKEIVGISECRERVKTYGEEVGIPVTIYETLKDLAETDNRSLNKEIEYILKKYIEEREKENNDSK